MRLPYDLFGLCLLTLLLTASQATSTVAEEERVLFDFSDPAKRGRWQNVNDGVMGGVSSGRHAISEDGLRFFGRLSLANNGGFASVRSGSGNLRLNASDQIHIRVKGDGRKYYVDLRTPSNRMAYTHRVSVQTEPDRWLEFRIPLELFKATSFGRVVSNSGGLDANRVSSIGFTLSDKKPGPFDLQVAWIKVAKPGN